MSRIVTYNLKTGRPDMDESGPITPPPVMPSPVESAGGMATRAIERIDAKLSEKALLLNIIDGLLELLGTDGVSLDSFRTDNRKCATVKRESKTYEVRRRP